MINNLSERLAQWIIRNDPDSTDDYDLFVYVIQCAFGLVLANGILLIISCIIGMPLQAVLWIIFYNALRFFIGGSHASSLFWCILGGTIFALLCVITADFLASFPVTIPIEIGVSIITTFFVAPIVHPNRLISDEKIKKNHRTGKAIVIIESTVIVLFYFFTEPWIAQSASLGMFTAAVLCIIGKLSSNKTETKTTE